MFDEHVGNILGVEYVRTANNRPPKRGRFKQIMTACLHEAATNKRNIARRIKKRQLAHRVAEKHFDRRLAMVFLRARDVAEPLLIEKLANARKALRVTRHKQ